MTEPLHRTDKEELEHLQKIIAAAYQIAGAYGAPDHILDVLSGPMFATDKQVDAMLPFLTEHNSPFFAGVTGVQMENEGAVVFDACVAKLRADGSTVMYDQVRNRAYNPSTGEEIQLDYEEHSRVILLKGN